MKPTVVGSLSLWLGPRRWHESAWCLLGFAGGNGFNHADRAGFRHVFSDPRCLFSRYPLTRHCTITADN
jgi:hypothetical protein